MARALLVLLGALAMARAGPASPDVEEVALCECACTASAGAQRTVQWYEAPKEDDCSVSGCRSEFASACPSGAADITVTYYNCGCGCCFAADCPTLTYYGIFARSSSQCSPKSCSASTLGCPDPGGNNAGAEVKAYWHGVDPPSLPPPAEVVLDHNCQCTCAFTEADEPRTYTLALGARQACTPTLCSSSFSNCPDIGSHNAGGSVIATAYDCMCSCCRDTPCVSRLLPWASGSPDACTKDGCSAAHYGCPVPADKPNGVNATFTSPLPARPYANGATSRLSEVLPDCMRRTTRVQLGSDACRQHAAARARLTRPRSRHRRSRLFSRALPAPYLPAARAPQPLRSPSPSCFLCSSACW